MKRDPLPALGPVPASPAVVEEGRWARAAALLAVVLVVLVASYWNTAAGMVAIWYRSETFAHGFVVPVIVAWLVWRSRAAWLTESPRPSPLWLLPLAACGAAWLAGELGTINALSELAFVAMVVCTVPLTLGPAIARRLAFPLAFLFFAVPIGEFMLPALMQWTADFTVWALRLTGIPVYREGQQIVIPSGRWSVVEACSGIRYLIASFMVGTLYAYLSFSSTRRRLAFVGISILIPIVANWVRAYLIVLIGHLSSNRLAVGVDHIIYGWLFFGFVMFLMLWAGSHWRETTSPSAPSGVAARQPRPPAVQRHAAVAMTMITLAVILAWPLAERHLDAGVGHQSSVDLQPLPDLQGWQARVGRLAAWEPMIEAPSAVLEQTFTNGGRAVGLYVAFFQDQSHTRKIASSTNVLAGSGIVGGAGWAVIGENAAKVPFGAETVPARQFELGDAADDRLLALRWYWLDGRVTASDAMAKVYTLLSRLHGRDDGAIVIVYTRKNGAERQAVDAFLRDAGPLVEDALRRAAATP
jgi:exosortase A